MPTAKTIKSVAVVQSRYPALILMIEEFKKETDPKRKQAIADLFLKYAQMIRVDSTVLTELSGVKRGKLTAWRKRLGINRQRLPEGTIRQSKSGPIIKYRGEWIKLIRYEFIIQEGYDPCEAGETRGNSVKYVRRNGRIEIENHRPNELVDYEHRVERLREVWQEKKRLHRLTSIYRRQWYPVDEARGQFFREPFKTLSALYERYPDCVAVRGYRLQDDPEFKALKVVELGLGGKRLSKGRKVKATRQISC